MSWLDDEARKADPQHDRMILENPDALLELDALLVETFEPYIRGELARAGYPYAPPAGERWIESKWMGPELARALTFMIFDHLSFPFFRGAFCCTRRGFFLERECSLGFPRETDPSLLFRILSDESFRGNPPELTIQPSPIHPEWDVYLHITLSAGTGLETGPWTLHEGAKTSIKEAIEDSVEMYEIAMVDGLSTMQDLEDLLRAARRSYESGQEAPHPPRDGSSKFAHSEQSRTGDCKLVVDALIAKVAIKHKEVVIALTPPLGFLGFISTELAPNEEKRKVQELRIYLAYDLWAYNGAGSHGAARVGTGLSGREYTLQSAEDSAHAIRAHALLSGRPALTIQTTGAVCAIKPWNLGRHQSL